VLVLLIRNPMAVAAAAKLLTGGRLWPRLR
jgi:hypothetical protein